MRHLHGVGMAGGARETPVHRRGKPGGIDKSLGRWIAVAGQARVVVELLLRRYKWRGREAPSTKSQYPNKHQIPHSKFQTLGAWCLVLGACFVLGFWCLGFHG